VLDLDCARYWHDPAHDAAIVCHELGHHVTRHTADFCVNRRRPQHQQANRKIPLDEGTSDYLAATLLGTPDIYGWHRAAVPSSSPRRRRLDGPWTMAAFVGGHLHDPHADGVIWAAALWATRGELQRRGIPAERFDALLLRALDRVGRTFEELPLELARRRRRSFALLLEAILDEDPAQGGALGATVESVFAQRGIRVGAGNDELRDRAREGRVLAVASR